MSNEEAKRKVKEILREIQAEESQASLVQPPKKLGFYQRFYNYLVEQGEISPEEEDRLKPRNMYSYADQASQDMVVQLNKDYYKQAKDEAKRRGMSLSSYVRESLLHRLKKISPEKELEIDKLLSECTSLEDEQITFIVEGEQGFLNQLAQKDLTGEVWTPSQIDKVVLRISRSPKQVEDQCIQAMKLDKMQTQYFKAQLEYVRNTQPEQENLFVPFGICDQCNRPLTKDQFNNLSNCPYCKGTKGTRFVYDEKSPAQPKPIAICEECNRPLPKECVETRECKYCEGGPVRVLNYEGIKTPTSLQTPDTEQTEEILEELAETETPEETEEA
jgi:predicted Zn-ribbon and HTH transcriptional regulator